MSDTWYRDRSALPPPYEDFQGFLWTWDGICLNPVHTCEPPVWLADMRMIDFEADVNMSFREYLGIL